MSKAKHTLTKDMEASLREIAERLPVPELKYRTPVPGWQLRKEQPELRGPQGEEIDPTKDYYVGAPAESVNHLRRMRREFLAGGIEAVATYLQPYEAFLGQE